MKKNILLLLFVSYLYSGYQLEIPLNRQIFIGFSAPYTNDKQSYKTNFPYYANKYSLKKTKIPILDALDMNLSDNNITKLLNNTFDLKNIQKYDGYNYNDITINISHFDIEKGVYLQYSSKNISSQSNTLTHFEAGKGYYILISSTKNTRRVGLIAGKNFNLKGKKLLIKKAGWYMLSFNDDILSQSSSAIFIPYKAGSFLLGGVDGEFAFNVTFHTDARQSARAINHQVIQKRNNGYPLYMVAYPAKQIINGTSIDGVIVISDTLMETSSANAISVSNRPLAFSQRSLQENIVAFKFNDKNLTYPSQLSITNTQHEKIEIPLTSASTIDQKIQVIDSKLSKIAQNSYGIYKIDGDFNATSNSYNYILLALDVVFGIKEELTIKSYKKFSNTGKFLLEGENTKRINKISDIPSVTNATKIHLVDNNSTFSITSTSTSDIHILEDGSNSIKPIANTDKGYITSFYKDINLFNSIFTNNRDNILDSNEGYNSFDKAYFKDLKNKYSFSKTINHSQTLLYFNNLGYKANSFYTLNISKNSWLYATIDNLSRQENMSLSPSPLGSIYKEKGYFVYLEPANTKILKIVPIDDNCHIVNYFNNSGDLKTYNDVNCHYSFSVDLLKNSKDIYTAIFMINNIAYEIIEKNGKFEFDINSQEFNLESDKDYPITIALLDSEGNQAIQQLSTFAHKKPLPPKNQQTKKVHISNDTIIYADYISDTDLDKNKIGVGKRYYSSDKLSWDKLNGNTLNLLAVNKDSRGLYSDIVKFKYYPLLDPTISFVNETKTSNKLIQMNAYVSKVKIYFKSIKNPTFIGSFSTMYLKVDNTLIASLIYDPRYSGSVFYVEHDTHLYKGVFSKLPKYNSDSSAYHLIKLR